MPVNHRDLRVSVPRDGNEVLTERGGKEGGLHEVVEGANLCTFLPMILSPSTNSRNREDHILLARPKGEEGASNEKRKKNKMMSLA